MKRTLTICLQICLIAAYNEINAAAHAPSAADRLEASAATLSPFSASKRALSQAEIERLQAEKERINNKSAALISVNELIDILTEAYLQDPVASRLLFPVAEKLQQSFPYYRLPLSRTVSTDHLATLIEAAEEGKLPNYLTPLEFSDLILALHPSNIGDAPQALRELMRILTIAAVNYNLRENPTYSMLRHDQRQNELLQKTDSILHDYYASIGRTRKMSSMPLEKRSRLQRWFTLRK
jgi:hypothetical protein